MGSMRLLVGSGAAVVAVAGLWAGAPGRSAAATVKVERGQTLTAIAARYHTTVAELARLNGLRDPDQVVAGQTLRVPAEEDGTSGGAGGDGSRSVRVGRGQTLTAIAARYHTTVAELTRLNGLRDPDQVVAGQTLRLPAGHGAAVGNGAGSTGVAGGRPMPSPARLSLVPLFHRWAGHYGVPVSLLEALTWWESGWQQEVVSSTGAVGIGQLEPGTVRDMRAQLGDSTLSAHSRSDNIRMSAAYLAGLLRAAGGDRSVALAAYYQGLNSVQAEGPLPATRHYVQGILAYERIFETSGP